MSNCGNATIQYARCAMPDTINQTGVYDNNGFSIAYKTFCIDVDGIPNNATASDCVNECPFGYGIRYDGKILTGARADEWLEKSVQGKE